MRSIELLPLAVYAPGVLHRSAVIDMPEDASTFCVHVARCTQAQPELWADPGCFIDLYCDACEDGENWLWYGHCASGDGRFINRHGQELPSLSLRPISPKPPGVSVKLTFKMKTSAAIKTRMWVEFQ